jgi:[protein-PII] uridylyltransferase
MLQLHKATLLFLSEGREKFTRKLDSDRRALRTEVIKLMPEEFEAEIKQHFQLTPAAAFAYREAGFIVTQIEAVHSFLKQEKSGENPFASSVEWIDHPDTGYSELIVATRDRPLHLEKLCCALASEQINILSADLFTRNDSVVLNIFRVCTTNFEPITDAATRKRFVKTFTKILEAEKYEPEKYLKVKANFLKPRTETDLPIPVRAHVSNDLHPTCTTVEIQALDRIGLLHDLFYTINEAGLDTSHARICTEKGVAMDTLYITTSDDKQIEDPELLAALETKFNSLVARSES